MSRRLLCVLLVGILISLSACSNSTSTDSYQADNQKTEQQEADKDMVDQKEENKENQLAGEDANKKSEDTVSNEDKSVDIQLYVSNDDATEFVSESVKIDELTPENIVNALVQKSVLPSDIHVLKCEEQIVDGVKSLDVDFNEAFGAYVCSMGTTGEYYTIGSIVNTFLDAYGCEKVKITVEGNTLESGHAEYPGYMNRFE